MRLKFSFFLITLYCTIGASRHVNNDEIDLISPSTTSSTSTPSPSPDNYLDNISIQDVLSSDIDASEKIEKKIINAVKEYSSKCRNFRKIHPSVNRLDIRPIIVDLGEANAIFHQVGLHSDPSLDKYTKQSYSFLIGCESSRMARIEVKLPQGILIIADLKITKITNSSNEFQPDSDITDHGFITVTLRNNAFSKQFSISTNNSTNNEDNIATKIHYTSSEVKLRVDSKFQVAIYSKMKIWFDQMESPIKQHLVEKLDLDLAENGISVADICSKFITADKKGRKVNVPFLNNNFNHLYVIPNAKLETWKGIDLSAGPIVIGGLLSFNSTEFIVSENEPPNPDGEDGYYLNIPPSYNDKFNETTVRIKTNELKGKLDWSYNSKHRSFSFALEFIKFEIKESENPNYTVKTEDYHFQSSHNGESQFYPSGSYYTRSTESKTEVNVYLGNLQIISTNSSVCENDNEFVNFVIIRYLRTVIEDSLKNSLSKRIFNDSSFGSCF